MKQNFNRGMIELMRIIMRRNMKNKCRIYASHDFIIPVIVMMIFLKLLNVLLH